MYGLILTLVEVAALTRAKLPIVQVFALLEGRNFWLSILHLERHAAFCLAWDCRIGERVLPELWEIYIYIKSKHLKKKFAVLLKTILVSIQTSKYFTKSIIIIIVVIVWFPQVTVRPYRSRSVIIS